VQFTVAPELNNIDINNAFNENEAIELQFDRPFFHIKMIVKLSIFFLLFSSHFKGYFYYLFFGVMILYYQVKLGEFNFKVGQIQ